MKASELVAILNKKIAQVGDVEVKVRHDEFEMDSMFVYPETDSDTGNDIIVIETM